MRGLLAEREGPQVNFLSLAFNSPLLDKLDLLLREKQAELQTLLGEMTEALTGIESPDYEWAARVQPLIYGVRAEIERLEKLRRVYQPADDFSTHLSRLLTDNTVTTLELWTHIKDHWNDVAVRLLEIKKLRSGYVVSCTLRITAPIEGRLYGDRTTEELQHLGWTAGRGGKTFWYKARVKNPDQFDAFCQRLAVTMLEALPGLWRHGRQYFRFV